MTPRAAIILSATLGFLTLAPSPYAATATIRVTVSPGRTDWPAAPVRVPVDSLLRARGWTAPVSSSRVVVREAGRNGAVAPHRAAWGYQGVDEGIILFAKTGTGVRTYEITVSDTDPADAVRRLPVVGLGEPLTYGRTGVTGPMHGSFCAHAEPVDWDGDGDTDLLVEEGQGGGATWTMHGMYYFENIGTPREPLLAPARWVPVNRDPPCVVDWNNDGLLDIVAGKVLHLNRGPRGAFNFAAPESLTATPGVEAMADWDGDGLFDIFCTSSRNGEEPSRSVWDKKTGFIPHTPEGVWRGFTPVSSIHVYRNTGRPGAPRFEAPPELVTANSVPIELQFGIHIDLDDVDNDGDLDLIAGNNFDVYFFENVGTRTAPRLAQGFPLPLDQREILIWPRFADINGDGKRDIVMAIEYGDVRWFENLGRRDGAVAFGPMRRFSLREPFIDDGCDGAFDLADVNRDGKPDIIMGNANGETWQWLSLPGEPAWVFDLPRRVLSEGRPFRIVPGAWGSIQGPGEARWGYVAPEITDWNGDGLLDLILADALGKHRFYPALENGAEGLVLGAEDAIRFADPANTIKPAWTWWDPQNGELVTQWRTRTEVLDWNGDGVTDYVSLDHEGYLALFPGIVTPQGKRIGALQRVFLNEQGEPLLLDPMRNGHSGRYRLAFADWDGDGDLDLIRGVAEPTHNRMHTVETEAGNAFLYENIGGDRFAFRGEMVPDPGLRLAAHAACPQPVDWDGDGRLDMLIGGEDGLIYAFHRAYLEQDLPKVRVETVRVRR
ncbi:MAG TPA: VCBS repeat-containing protein [Candidatus Latescibacteria bacterium]|nr:VCBS repeat-containing protein [Candidatus Latescibacterota bacterium]